MKVIINYNSKWGNSFLSEKNEFKVEDNVHKNRSYVASLSKINSFKNKNNSLNFYKQKEIGLDTVYGLLYRLIGARKPLEKVLVEDSSILKVLIEKNKINFEEKTKDLSDESVYLRNDSLSTDQNSYSGIPDNSIFLIDDFIHSLDILFYSRQELIDFILFDKKVKVKNNIKDILSLSKKIEELNKKNQNKITEQESILINTKINKIFKTEIKEGANLALLALNKSIHEASKNNLELKSFLTSSMTLTGVALAGRSFTIKDFMRKFANPKIVYGNPYQTDFWIPNPYNDKNMKFNKKMTKKNGVLTINIDCSFEEAEEIKSMIENAGVSAFYVGKKGLGYVEKIIT